MAVTTNSRLMTQHRRVAPLIGLCSAIFLLTNTAAGAAEIHRVTQVSSTEARAVLPAISIRSRAEIGEPILVDGLQAVLPAIDLQTSVSIDNGRISVAPGVLRQFGVDGDGRYYASEKLFTDSAKRFAPVLRAGVYIPNDPTAGAKAFWMDNDSFAKSEAISPPTYVVTTHRQLLQRANRRLTYAGVSGATLKLSYMEFTDAGLARPAFSQELSYDLSAGDEVGFKGARLKILKATNTSLEYIVLEDMD